MEENEEPVSRHLYVDQFVHIADPDVHECEVIGATLRIEGFEVVFSLHTFDFLERLASRTPNFIVLSEAADNGNGLELLQRIKSKLPYTPIIFIANSPSVEIAVAALKYGAMDVFGLPLNAEKLVRALLTAARSHLTFSQRGNRAFIGGYQSLTNRERQVFELILDGFSTKEAGLKLGISPRTVEVHRARVMAKFGARNAAQLVRFALAGAVNVAARATDHATSSHARLPAARPHFLRPVNRSKDRNI